MAIGHQHFLLYGSEHGWVFLGACLIGATQLSSGFDYEHLDNVTYCGPPYERGAFFQKVNNTTNISNPLLLTFGLHFISIPITIDCGFMFNKTVILAQRTFRGYYSNYC